VKGIDLERREEMVTVARAPGISEIAARHHEAAEVDDLDGRPNGEPRREMRTAFGRAT
jgi:hypothetical protein